MALVEDPVSASGSGRVDVGRRAAFCDCGSAQECIGYDRCGHPHRLRVWSLMQAGAAISCLHA